MPKYTVATPADHTGTAHCFEIDAATPWLAIERSQKQYGWMIAELFERGRSLGTYQHLPLRRQGVWQIVATGPKSG